jgi:signal transduction histidine kinase/CheY-like chemotaxis protein
MATRTTNIPSNNNATRTKRQRLFIPALIAVVAAIILIAGSIFYHYTQEQLYQESVAQLEEMSQQLFEKLGVQIEIQWGYTENLEQQIKEAGTLTEGNLATLIAHSEKDLSPVGKQIYLRVIDEDGYYYTDTGKQGLWTGVDQLTDVQQQSFMIADWLNGESYMAFALKAEEGLTVDGCTIKYLIVLRSMEDMQPFFHSSAYGSNNVSYIISYDGYVLAEDGALEGIEFEGTNIFRSMENQTFPHVDSFETVREMGYPSGTVCTDVIINNNNNKFYLVYDRLPDYDWAVLMLISANDVAVSTTNMIGSLLTIFVGFVVALVIAGVVLFLFTLRRERDKKLMEEREKNARLLEKTNADLQASEQKAQEALVIAEEATKAKSMFLANMSHDIRTPMNAIMGMTSLMEHEIENPDKLRYYVKKLDTSGRHMLGLINDILDMSKIESGEVQLSKETVKMAEQAGQIESIIRSQSDEKGQTFTVRVYEVTHEYLIGDCIRIRQVFINLLNNAVKYTPQGGAVRFEIRELPCEMPDHATILTSVIDNGIGMSQEFLKVIFEPFTREESSVTNKIQGTGLGMSITKSLVNLMGGTITATSELGQGSRFDVTLTLPIDKEAMQVPGIKRVLLVSEEELLINNLTASLHETSVGLLVVGTPEEAAETLRTQEIDAVVLHGYLTSQSLAETVAMLREAAAGGASSTRKTLIFCCDYTHEESVRDAIIDSGIDGLIARPFFFENLVLAIEHSREAAMSKKRENDKNSLSGKRFLCAEDNVLNAEILEALLEMHNATCTIYPDGAELVRAFETIKPGEYDAILMDMQMPNMNGVQATQAIREGANPLGKTIPIIAMTANAFSTDVEECLNAGMDAHLAKPLDITALGQTLQEVLSSRL